jgi:hypothetical protein
MKNYVCIGDVSPEVVWFRLDRLLHLKDDRLRVDPSGVRCDPGDHSAEDLKPHWEGVEIENVELLMFRSIGEGDAVRMVKPKDLENILPDEH